MQEDNNLVAESGKWWLYTGFPHSYLNIGTKVLNKKRNWAWAVTFGAGLAMPRTSGMLVMDISSLREACTGRMRDQVSEGTVPHHGMRGWMWKYYPFKQRAELESEWYQGKTSSLQDQSPCWSFPLTIFNMKELSRNPELLCLVY